VIFSGGYSVERNATYLVFESAKRTPTQRIRTFVWPGDDLLRVRGRGWGWGRWWHSRIHGYYNLSAQHVRDGETKGCDGRDRGIYGSEKRLNSRGRPRLTVTEEGAQKPEGPIILLSDDRELWRARGSE
jgi:hypothetical protein